MKLMEIGQNVVAIDNKPLPGNSVAPPLEVDKEYKINQIIKCRCEKEHYDVGLVSAYNWITCHSCGQELPSGDSIHWCHPSRFK